ncbi:hypothetical protein HDF22_005795 [Mucilaginibacter lappiensis]|uniref:Uncharacterized protein n=1 Tax=Mucilaginibacter lappiensis TaxID=354630 RepID=A0A841JMH8_9SPHI|nr:hypothetical protein [Mucilaginibacter lappiensis]
MIFLNQVFPAVFPDFDKFLMIFNIAILTDSGPLKTCSHYYDSDNRGNRLTFSKE